MVSFRAEGESFGSSLVSQIDPIESTRSRARPGFCIDVISKRADDRSKIGADEDKHPLLPPRRHDRSGLSSGYQQRVTTKSV
jgi:hypothetical protein